MAADVSPEASKSKSDVGSSSAESSDADKPLDEKARRRAELESFLGPNVRAPVEIPLSYAPSDRSIHPLFHIEVSHLDYAGPLDLLLYLIRRHDLDVLDIPVAFVTEKYLAMLEALEALEIDLAAEFLVLAAELAHIKSKMLLPAEKGVPVEDSPEEVDEGDPRAELVRRLLEYQKYRDAAAQLSSREQLGRDVFPRVPPVMEKAEDVDPGLKQVSVFRLVELMAKLLKDVPVHHEISYEHYSIGERIQYVSAFGEAHEGRFTVMSLMQEIRSRQELVVTFIALLEMAKMGLARIFSDVFHERRDRLRQGGRFVGPGSPESQVTGVSEETIPTDPEADAASAEGEVLDTTAAAEAAERMATEDDASAPNGVLDTTAVAEAAERMATEDDASAPKDAGTEGQPPAAAVLSDPDRGEEVAAAKREAEALVALADEAAQAGAVDEDAVDYPNAPDEESSALAERLEPLPEIWVELTDRRFQGDLVDDYM